MFLNLIGFELRYHHRQIATRASWIAFFALGLLISFGNFGSLQAYRNAPVTIAFALAIISLGTPIMLALLAGGAILRDHDYRMAPIVFATSTTHFHYLVSRFAGFAVCGILAFLPAVLGLMLGHFLPFHEASTIGSFRPSAYLWAFLVIGLPNVFFGAAIIFGTAALTRNGAATYISGIFLYILYFLGSMLGNSPFLASSSLMSPEDTATSALLDPYGLVALLEQVRYWTVAEKNEHFLQLSGPFLLNRLFCFAVALSIFAITHRLFKFRQGLGKKKASKDLPDTTVYQTDYRPVATVPNRLRSHYRAWWSQTKMGFRTMIFGIPFYAFLVLWSFFLFMSFNELKDPLDIAILPFGGVVLGHIHGPLLKFGVLVIVFYTLELLGNDRKVGMDGFLDSSPAPNLVFWASKVSAIGAMIGTFICVTFLAVVCFQWSQGLFQLDFALFGIAFIRVGLSLLLVAILTLAIGTALPNKYAAMAIAFFLIIPFSGLILGSSPGIEHPMLRFGYLPEFLPSSMAGTSYHWPATKWYLGYWSALCGLIGLLTLRFWRRGLGMPTPHWSKGNFIATGICSLALMVFGGFIFYQTNITRSYRTKKDALDWLATYEKTYGQETPRQQPVIRHVEGTLTLLPSDRAYLLRTELTLENPGDRPMDAMLVGVATEVDQFQIDMPGTEVMERDDRYQQVRYRFEKPLAPGEKRHMQYQARVKRSAFQPKNPEHYILAQATYIEIEKVLPFFGFNENRKIENPRTRETYNLPPSQAYPPATQADAQATNWMTFDFVIATPLEQTALCSGDLKESWEADGQRFFRYASDIPVPMGLGVAAAPYASKKTAVDGTEIVYYHHPKQPFHADKILDAAVETLAYGTQNFGPYAHRQLQFAAISSFSDRVGGTAYPGTIYLVENRVILLDPKPGELDAVSRIVAHETGHQWWGKQVNPAPVAGAPSLTEMLAVYTEMAVTEQTKGPTETHRYLDKTDDLYFFMRTFESGQENPLVAVQFQPYIYYFKSAHVVHVLRELLGEAAFNRVLSQMLVDFPYPAQPTANDLLVRILEAAPSTQHETIRELLTQVVTYDLRLISASKEEVDGRWHVNLEIFGERTEMDHPGHETATALKDPLEIVFTQDGQPVHTETVSLDSVRQKITVITASPGDEVTLDPKRRRLEATRADNSVTIRIKPGS